MKLLQSGAPKAGNLWLYKILQEILRRSGRDTGSFIEQQPIYSLAKDWDLNYPEQSRIDVLEIMDLQYRYRISSIYNMPVVDIKEYVSQTNHVWTHSPVCKRSGEAFKLFDKIVYIVRDPRDRIISAAKYYTSDYMQKYFPQPIKEPEAFLNKNFAKLMHEWLWHVFDHLRLRQEFNIHIAFFEGFNMNFQKELSKLLRYLEIDISAEDKQELEEAVSFSKMKEKNPKHLNKGTSGQWMEKLTDEQVEKANIIAAPLIDYLGYPLHKNSEMQFSAKLPSVNFNILKQEILQSQEQLY